jgi:hypothetical protein
MRRGSVLAAATRSAAVRARRESAGQNARKLAVAVSDLPDEAKKLLAVAPEDFVTERQRLAKELRGAGRNDDAATVGRLRKPPPAVLAVNRAARDRPKAARAAADAAAQVVRAQFGGAPDEYAQARAELDDALDLLADVAIAHVSHGKKASDAVRRRVRDLLRSAVADETAREALTQGVLTEEVEAAGFAPFAGISPKPARRTGKPSATQARRQEEKRRAEMRAVREELARAEHQLRDAERAAREAEKTRSSAESAVASLREKLDRLR